MRRPKDTSESEPNLPSSKATGRSKKRDSKRSQQEQQEELFLLQGRHEAIQQDIERKRRERAEIVELLSGQLATVGGLSGLHILVEPLPHDSLFPHACSFFEQLLRMNWPGVDPKKYVKPAGVGKAILEIIYGRFQREVLPVLNRLNPRRGGRREYKLFQHLDAEGQAMVIKFRDEAITVMEECDDLDWTGFRQKMLERYGVPYQADLFNSKP